MAQATKEIKPDIAKDSAAKKDTIGERTIISISKLSNEACLFYSLAYCFKA